MQESLARTAICLVSDVSFRSQIGPCRPSARSCQDVPSVGTLRSSSETRLRTEFTDYSRRLCRSDRGRIEDSMTYLREECRVREDVLTNVVAAFLRAASIPRKLYDLLRFQKSKIIGVLGDSTVNRSQVYQDSHVLSISVLARDTPRVTASLRFLLLAVRANFLLSLFFSLFCTCTCTLL